MLGLRWPYDMGQGGEVVNLEIGPQKVPVGGRERAAKASHGDAAPVTPWGPPEKRREAGMRPVVSPLPCQPLSPSPRRGEPKKITGRGPLGGIPKGRPSPLSWGGLSTGDTQ